MKQNFCYETLEIIMKKLTNLMVGVSAALIGSSAVYAHEGHEVAEPEKYLNGTVSTWVELATDYVFRGESETNDGEIPSIKVAVTWTHDSGFYAGLYFADNLFPDSSSNGTNDAINSIYGPYIGIAGAIGDTGFSYNSMLFQYIYPGDSDSNYLELFNYLTLPAMGNLTLKLEFSPTITDWFGVDDLQSYNYAIHPSYSLPAGVTLSGTYGFQEFDEPSDAGYSNVDWQHWNIGVSKVFAGWNVDVRYHDTDIKKGKHDFYGFDYNHQIVDDRVVLAVSRTF